MGERLQPAARRSPVLWACAVATLCALAWYGGRHSGLNAAAAVRRFSSSPAAVAAATVSTAAGHAPAADPVAAANAAGAWGEEQPIGADERSFYSQWIEQDFSHWKETGITQQMVDHAFALAHTCDRAIIRFQVINGSLWAYGTDPPVSHYDAKPFGPGYVGGWGRGQYVLVAVMEVLQMFPGQIPDLDAVMQLGDVPCITEKGTIFDGRKVKPPWIQTPNNPEQAAKEAAAAGFVTDEQRNAAAAPPLFAYNSRKGYRDIPFPDYTFYTHNLGILSESKGRWVHAWDARLENYVARYQNMSLAQKYPQLIWRGRHNAARDVLRRTFKDCLGYLKEKNAGGVLNFWENWGFSGIDPINICHWRYLAYLESYAWSTSLKNKMACGGVLMTPVMEYYEFFSRALQPGVHYVELSHKPGEMCEDIARNVKAMNAWLEQQKAEAQREAAANITVPVAQRRRHLRGEQQRMQAGDVAPDPSVLETQQHQRQEHWLARNRRRLQMSVYGYPPQKARSNFSQPWDSDLLPTQVAENARQFLLDHVRMRDVRLYVRDVLQQYAKLQRFTPKVHPKSTHYTGVAPVYEFHKASLG